jgi:hypothetical protein
MRAQRVEAIIRYGEAMVRCYDTQSERERRQVHDWESSARFTRNGDWRGWVYIGLRPGAVAAKPYVVGGAA